MNLQQVLIVKYEDKISFSLNFCKTLLKPLIVYWLYFEDILSFTGFKTFIEKQHKP